MASSQQHHDDAAKRRLSATVAHLKPQMSMLIVSQRACSGKQTLISTQDGDDIRVDAFPMHKQDLLKWNGWGYRDAGFELQANGVVIFRGQQYDFGGTEMHEFLPWMEDKRGINPKEMSLPCMPFADKINKPFIVDAFVRAIEGCHGGLSFNNDDRLFHAHGHTIQEINVLREGKLENMFRVPDAVVWPQNAEQCRALVDAAQNNNVVLIPFGGGTTVCGAVMCPENETRMIISVDTSKMNRILWIDTENMMARIEAGVCGEALERKLQEFGVTMGHTPDSYEFSTLGGWVATRASGMKKNIYGNIEDILIRAQLVTPTSTIEKSVQVPRISAGPDVNEFIMGSEGTMGIVTEVTVKIRKSPEVQVYDGILFPDFASGVAFMTEVALRQLQPASCRLIDNEQFQLGHILREEVTSTFTAILDALKTFYVTKVKGFDKTKLCVCTLLFEGEEKSVKHNQKMLHEIAGRNKGMVAGEDAGKRGYLMTFVIAYIRDIGFDYRFIAESFETSCPFSCIENLCRNTKDRIYEICKEAGCKGSPFASCRVTQLYDTGVCVYFYFGFLTTGLADPMATFHKLEVACREEVLANGGSVSHHHGIGKTRKQWLPGTISDGGIGMLKGVKNEVDPKNIFAVGNLY